MAIKFENDDGKPAKKTVGGKTYVAEEPASSDQAAALPFAKPVRADKKGAKIRNKPSAAKGRTPAA